MTRRILISSLALLFLPRTFSAKKSLKVVFSVDLKKLNLSSDEFFSLRKEYEDDNKIDVMNSLYEKKGLILYRSYSSTDSQLQWVYKFKDLKAFENWEKSLYEYGMVQKDGRPYSIDREYIVIS